MTHRYTILRGGLVRDRIGGRGAMASAPTAIAYAAERILALGSDDEVTAISRGDSRFVDLGDQIVMPLAEPWFEIGGRADLVIVGADDEARVRAVVVAGDLVWGALEPTGGDPEEAEPRGAGPPDGDAQPRPA